MKFLLKFTASYRVIKIIMSYEPLYITYVLPQVILTAVLPLLYVYFPKLIIEKLSNSTLYTDIIKLILLYAGILLTINIAKTYLSNKSSLYAEKFSRKLKNKIGIITMELELKDIESAGFSDTIQMANNATGLTETIGIVQKIVANVITIIGLSYIIVQLDWLFILLVTATLAVKVLFVYLRYSYNKMMRKFYARNNRHGNYLMGLSYFNEGGAKEIRLNNLQNWFMGKIKSYRNEMVTAQYKDFVRNTIFNIITVMIMALQSFVVLWLLSTRYIEGILSIADFTLYFSAVIALTSNLTEITEKIGSYNQQILNANDYKRLTDVKNNENINHYNTTNNIEISHKTEFAFCNVSFTYPNTDRQVLDNINLKITNMEKLVVVGYNGAGKTTFIKLLCKFYRPTVGTITLNGIDVWDIPNKEYYKVIAAVFQDHANFAFSLKENVSMSEDVNMEKVTKIIDEVGLGDHVRELPKGYATYLSKNFDSSGVEFSGGEGQKVAIARAIYKDTPVLIFDEPTASLDPKAESDIYTSFFNIAKNKTAIFISHRLAASNIADNIAVFSDGRIDEYGSHSTLMAKNGIYAEMYRKQSRPYMDNKIF